MRFTIGTVEKLIFKKTTQKGGGMAKILKELYQWREGEQYRLVVTDGKIWPVAWQQFHRKTKKWRTINAISKEEFERRRYVYNAIGSREKTGNLFDDLGDK